MSLLKSIDTGLCVGHPKEERGITMNWKRAKSRKILFKKDLPDPECNSVNLIGAINYYLARLAIYQTSCVL
jgi:hypothetical protein